MTNRLCLRCNAVKYRQGFLEVVDQIHPGLINLETWQAHPDADLAEPSLGSDGLTEDDFVANTELELTPAEARALAAALLAAADAVERLPPASRRRAGR